MIEVKGAFATAKVFTITPEETALEQIKALCNMDFVADSQIRIMPDVHAGKGCTIGTTMTISDKIVPNLVGVDIGCGMETVALQERDIDLAKLDKVIYNDIPAGYQVRKAPHRYTTDVAFERLAAAPHLDIARARHSMGTLGGGNHFIEVSRGEDDVLYLVVHSGSRRLGLEVAEHYQKAGYQALKAAGLAEEIPYNLAYVEGDLYEAYLHDMQLVQHFAATNRKAMLDVIMAQMGLHATEAFTTTHNYIDTEGMILRKGAVSAQAGELLLVPINMRDGSLICRGKGNADWNYSAPHGAGRLMSRNEAKRTFQLADFVDEMAGIYTTSVHKNTLDECPMAYKDMAEIMDAITPTAEILQVIKPIYNFKAGG